MLNGIDLKGLGAARDGIQAEPANGSVVYGVDMAWKGGVQMEASATGITIGSESIERDYTWTVDEPPQLLGKASGPTPQEYLMSGVGA